MALTITKTPPTIIAARQPVVFTAQTDHAGLCRINGSLTGVNGLSVEPDNNHKVTFEFSDYVRDLPVLTASLTVPQVHDSACPGVTFTFSERYGTPPANNNPLVSAQFHLLAAKVPHWKHDFAGTIDTYLNETKPFLTWYPNTPRKVLPLETIHLYCLNTNIAISFQLFFGLTFTDGETGAFESEVYSDYVPAYGIVQLDASPAIVEAYTMANHPGKTVSKYTVLAVNSLANWIELSETRTFIINRLPYTNQKQIIFRNSFGAFDQLMLRGSATINAVTDRITSRQMASYDASPVPDRITWYNEGRQTFTAETGYMLAPERAWLNELLTSCEIYEKQGSVLIPLELRTEKFIQHNDDSALMSVAFEFGYMQTPAID